MQRLDLSSLIEICNTLQAAQGLADGTLKVNREPQGMKKWMRLAMVSCPSALFIEIL
jgi:hypothetical protein